MLEWKHVTVEPSDSEVNDDDDDDDDDDDNDDGDTLIRPPY